MTLKTLRPRVLLAGWSVVLVAVSLFSAETEIRYLSGTGPDDAVEWEFFCTAGRKSGEWSTIAVPSCWEQQGFGTYQYGRGTPVSPLADEEGRYRHAFHVPELWQGKAVRIVFDGSMTDTKVTINGQSAGPTHQGAFYRFHYDITPLLKFGEENLLEVTVAKVSANQSVNAAEREADYWVFGGIFRPVWLEARPREFIDWTAIDARANGDFLIEVHLGTPAPANGEIAVQIRDSLDSRIGEPMVAQVAEGDEKIVVTGSLEGINAWTAETPHLYRAVVAYSSAGGGEGATHTVTERFGFRTFEVRENDGLYLNGNKIILKGINRHCFWPETGRTVSRAQSFMDARLIKEANMNAVRMAHYPPDKHFLEACDEVGLYVLDELAGWQAAYDTPTGRRLIGELVRRDVNHPSILFWDNGNEGGWNTENDDEFAKWDPQDRPVLHPWAVHDNINTDHYEDYASTVNLSAGPQIFMPTEMLHGLYDGGIGAGLRDYWDVMGRSPTVAGAFFWVWSDEGLVRTDQNGRIDNAGNQAPDGIVGPHREKEGSFLTVKEIWSPVQVDIPAANGNRLPREWDGTLAVENGYDFTRLDRCWLNWQILDLGDAEEPLPPQSEAIAAGQSPLPPIEPHGSSSIRLQFPPDALARGDALFVSAQSPRGEELWAWSWRLGDRARSPVVESLPSQSREPGEENRIEIGNFVFDRSSGLLREVRIDGRSIPFGNGPRVVAYRRNERVFEQLNEPSQLASLARSEDGKLVATYDGPLKEVRWLIKGDTAILTYEYEFAGAVDVLGVAFDYPEERVRSKRWLGPGPYRVYANRLEGGLTDIWELDYNNPIPGQTYAYPEFKGYFRDVDRLVLNTTDGTMDMTVFAPYLGLYAPADGEPSMLAFPDTGIAFLDVIPPIGTKFKNADTLGPQGQTKQVSGTKTGTVVFRFAPR